MNTKNIISMIAAASIALTTASFAAIDGSQIVDKNKAAALQGAQNGSLETAVQLKGTSLILSGDSAAKFYYGKNRDDKRVDLGRGTLGQVMKAAKIKNLNVELSAPMMLRLHNNADRSNSAKDVVIQVNKCQATDKQLACKVKFIQGKKNARSFSKKTAAVISHYKGN
jgi:hypothetical protein